MTGKSFTIDLGRIMDEAFQWAQEFSEAFQNGMHGMAGRFPNPEEMREKFRERFKCYEDLYPYYAYPPANIFLTKDKSLVFEFALAGFEEQNIDLQFRGDYLHFSAKAPEAGEPEEGMQFFKRRLKLKSIEEQLYYVPEDKFDRSRVEARFRNGLLRLTVPAKAEATPKEGIKVNIAS
jgi:HSP20 family molecular chaperone IbpA